MLPCCKHFATFHPNLNPSQLSAEMKSTLWKTKSRAHCSDLDKLHCFSVDYWQEWSKIPAQNWQGFQVLIEHSSELRIWSWLIGLTSTPDTSSRFRGLSGWPKSNRSQTSRPFTVLQHPSLWSVCTRSVIGKLTPSRRQPAQRIIFHRSTGWLREKQRETKQIRLGHLSVSVLSSSTILHGFFSAFAQCLSSLYVTVWNSSVCPLEVLTTGWGWG